MSEGKKPLLINLPPVARTQTQVVNSNSTSAKQITSSNIKCICISSGRGFAITFDGPTDSVTVLYKPVGKGLRTTIKLPEYVNDAWFHLTAVIDPTKEKIVVYINGQDIDGDTEQSNPPRYNSANGQIHLHTE